MSIADKLTQIAENEQKVYDAGYDKGELDFWNNFTNSGRRQNYYFAFMNTNFEGKVIPDGLCKPRTRLHSMFYQYNGTELPKGIDCIDFDTTRDVAFHAQAMFQYSYYLKNVYDMGIQPQKSYANTFGNCSALETIEALRSDDDTIWNKTFSECTSLTNLTIVGTIGRNGFNVSECPLTHDSLMSIINALVDYSEDVSGTSWVCTLGSVNLAKLTDAEKAIATERGWTLA